MDDVGLSKNNSRWVFGAFLAGLILRLLNLGGKSLWFDEAHAYYVANAGAEAFWVRGLDSFHPPLFFHLLQIWSNFGQEEAFLRILPALLASIGTIPIFIIGRRIFNSGVGLTAALLFALNPLVMWYSQELRMYAQFITFGLLSTACLATFISTENNRLKIWSALFFVMSTIGILYSHYLSMLFVYAQLLLLLVVWGFGRASLKQVGLWALGVAISVGFYWPWINSVPGNRFYTRLLSGDSVSYFSPLVSQFSDNIGLIRLVGAVLIVVAVAALVQIRWLREMAEKILSANWFKVGLFVFFVLFLAISVYPRGYTIKRHVLIYVPFLLIIVGIIWPVSTKNFAAVGLLCAASLVASLWNIYLIPKTEWEQINNQITADVQAYDTVLINPGHMGFAFDYYNEEQSLLITQRGDELRDALAQVVEVEGRVWYVAQPTDQNHRPAVTDALNEFLDSSSCTDFTKVQLCLYE
ncbi:MAG: glycosyltransferase family 39 protein [Chloroflexota bacterium]